MPAFVWNRVSVDWLHLSYDDFNSAVVNPVKFKMAVECWDRVAGLPYRDYRHQLKSISEMSWQALGVVANWQPLPDDAWIIPTDDDDWLSPDIELPNVDFVHWQTMIHCTQKSPRAWLHGTTDQAPQSNAYAVRVGFLRTLPPADACKLLSEHQKSLKIARRYTAAITFTPQTWSVYNLHPGSAHVLKSYRTERGVKRLFCAELPPLDQAKWASPYQNKFASLYLLARGANG